MKKIILLSVSAMIALSSTITLAESKVNKSIILNKSVNKGNAAISIGKDNAANIGSVALKDSKVNKSIILNKSVNKGNAAIAIGKDNSANVGSVELR